MYISSNILIVLSCNMLLTWAWGFSHVEFQSRWFKRDDIFLFIIVKLYYSKYFREFWSRPIEVLCEREYSSFFIYIYRERERDINNCDF